MSEQSKSQFPIVGIGASAGGIEALEHVFAPMPPDLGIAFVIVTHLSPERRSLLHEIVARFTAMPVTIAADGMRVQPNNVYILGENAIIGIADGLLQVREQDAHLRERKPIDVFLSDLAVDQNDYAVGIILSGGDGDGTLGIKAVKERGGLTIAQTGDGTAPRHSDMPANAIATGHVDLAIPAEMTEHLARYVHGFNVFDRPFENERDANPGAREAQDQIYKLLQTQIGHDFSGYKERTFNRRVHRRMQVVGLDTIEAYVGRLRSDAEELTALFRDLLINVTAFFRDADAFDVLRTLVIPKLFEDRGANDTVRMWVPGCATGEEVYSIAILVREHLDQFQGVPRVQIFATDIDDHSLAVARAGRYTEALLENISPERRRRFFRSENAHFMLTKEVRDLCIFSPHSVIRDPPFSRMDMISCRNLLIYFGSDVQSQVIPTFHYALRPGGYLFLGTSESINLYSELFAPVDKKQRIFRAREGVSPQNRVPLTYENLQSVLGSDFNKRSVVPLRQSVEAHVLERIAPAHVVVDAEGDIVFYSTRTGKYLEAATGAPSRQLLAIARKGLRIDLRTALREAAETKRPTVHENVVLETDDDRVQLVTITVDLLPQRDDAERLFIVVFADAGQLVSREDLAARDAGANGQVVHDMERELRDARERLQSMIEEYETALEELKSSNEELVSVNEELQSTNEELEASKEELHSLNEELQTVNIELIGKVDALDRSNTDLHNLFESTQIATIFLDTKFAIRHFTPPMSRLFNILPGDRGRPFSDLASKLDYPGLHDDIRRTLTSGVASERRVTLEADDAHYLVRLLPYRGTDHGIEGVIATFFDVTSLVQSELKHQSLIEEVNRRSRTMLAEVTNAARQALAETSSPAAFSKLLEQRLDAFGRDEAVSDESQR